MLAEYAIQNVKGIKRSFDNAASNRFLNIKDANLFNMMDSSEVSEIFTSTEGMTGAKELGELETPPTLSLEDGYSVTLTENLVAPSFFLKLNTRDMKVMLLSRLLSSWREREISFFLEVVNYFLVETHKMYNEAFSSTSDYLAPDGVEVCGTHTWKSGGTFDNGVTTVFSESAVDTAMEYAGAFTDPSGKPMPLNFDTIVVKKGSYRSSRSC